MDFMTLFDVIAGLLLLISALTAFNRGATRELLGMLAFVAAAIAAIAALRFSAPFFRSFMSPDWAAVTAALLVIFVLVFVVLKLFSAAISRHVQGAGALGALDRIIGAGFGLFRALIILGVFTLLVEMAGGEAGAPDWVKGATLYPLTAASGKVLKAFAPDGFATVGELAPKVERAVKAGAGYSDEQRDTMDDLVEKAR
jgi:membrane protein required for colicin V production